jgi:LAS superfamily LD-carboxypeptidase LdcB
MSHGQRLLSGLIIWLSVAVAVVFGARGIADDVLRPATDPIIAPIAAAMDQTLSGAEAVLAYQSSATAHRAARDALSSAITAAQATYEASAGKVTDEQVRALLDTELDQADAALRDQADSALPGQTDPTLPGQADAPLTDDPDWPLLDQDDAPPTDPAGATPAESPDTTKANPAAPRDDLALQRLALDAVTAGLDQATKELSAAEQVVKDAQTAWQADQDAKAAAAKAAVAAQYTGGNGRIDPATLCAVPYDTKQLLRCDAEAAWMILNAAYKAVWGEDIPLDLTYRTYDEQVEMKAIYGSGAAAPGTSNHGWGTAVDLPDWREGGLGLEWDYGTPKYEWMKANAPAYDWVNPSWAVQGGRGPAEPWHFEFVG